MFWPRLLRLTASVAVEILYNSVAMVAFLLRRGTERGRIARAMRSRPGFGLGAAALVGAALMLAPGCQPIERQPGSSFDKQVDETWWSVKEITTSPGWSESMLWDLEQLTDPELGQMEETLSLLGW